MKRAVFQVTRGKGNTATLSASDVFKISEEGVSSGTGTVTGIIIPKLRLKSSNWYNRINEQGRALFCVRDTLLAAWDSTEEMFLAYNPEIWVFRYNNHRRKKIDSESGLRALSINKKWKHEPHLNGVKFHGSKWYSGNSTIRTVPIPEIAINGRKTEFPLNSLSGEWKEIGFDCWDYIYGMDPTPETGGWVKLTDETDFSVVVPVVGTTYSSGQKRRGMPIRFAIVIDNPNQEADNPKIIGEMSDIWEMRLHQYQINALNGDYRVRVTYEQNFSFVKWGN